MRIRRLVLISTGALLLVVLVAVCFAPLIVAGGLRIWAQRAAARGGLRLKLGRIEAPFLRPVIVRDLRVRSEPGLPFQIEGSAQRVELALSLAGIFTDSQRPLRSLHVDGLTLNIRHDQSATDSARAALWPFFQKLLANNFKFSAVNLHLENGAATVDIRDGALMGSELDAGSLTAREIKIAAPWFEKTFANLRGVTSWQENRLSFGALTLIRGLNIDTITIDLSHIGRSRIGIVVIAW